MPLGQGLGVRGRTCALHQRRPHKVHHVQTPDAIDNRFLSIASDANVSIIVRLSDFVGEYNHDVERQKQTVHFFFTKGRL